MLNIINKSLWTAYNLNGGKLIRHVISYNESHLLCNINIVYSILNNPIEENLNETVSLLLKAVDEWMKRIQKLLQKKGRNYVIPENAWKHNLKKNRWKLLFSTFWKHSCLMESLACQRILELGKFRKSTLVERLMSLFI